LILIQLKLLLLEISSIVGSTFSTFFARPVRQVFPDPKAVH
jgi:hypothetical protein